ncbi:hypothetical protein DSL92_05660 [Billgrantia gudaonensis]|uniref:histidine kinase n=1 Tax=Billgrantia gudaonensis TaxID=376427 RepID=A0A3S0NES1_9GAMM|nr:hypothetical protein DSL92_05660 [Halomonas gudaonensis]
MTDTYASRGRRYRETCIFAAALIRCECCIVDASELAEDVPTLIWLENEKPSLDQDSPDLTDLLDSLLEDARYEYPGHRLHAELPHQARSTAASAPLAQAIENVIRNACTHTPEGGNVWIALHPEPGGFRLTVEDEGPGVAPRYRRKHLRLLPRAAGGSDKPAATGSGALAPPGATVGGWIASSRTVSRRPAHIATFPRLPEADRGADREKRYVTK